MRFSKRAAFIAGLCLLGMTVFAAQDTGSLLSSTQIQGQCNIVGGNISLAFGTYDPVSANQANSLDSATTFSLRCTRGVTATITLGDGLNYGDGTRRMNNQLGSFLKYQLYKDAGRSTVWDGSSALNYSATNNHPVGFNIYGRVPAGQGDVSAGDYSDTVVLTVTF